MQWIAIQKLIILILLIILTLSVNKIILLIINKLKFILFSVKSRKNVYNKLLIVDTSSKNDLIKKTNHRF